MDFSRLLKRVKVPTQSEAEAIEDLMKVGGRSVGNEVNVARQAALEDTFSDLPKSAHESAEVFEGKPLSLGGEEPSIPSPQMHLSSPGTEPTLGKSPEMLPVNLDDAASGKGMLDVPKGINPYLLGGATMAGGAGALAYSQGGDETPPPQQAPVGNKSPASVPSTPEPAEKEEPTPISKLESLLKPRSPAMHEMDFGDIPSNNTVAGLSEAQDARNQAVLTNQMGRAAELVGSSIARAKPIAQGVFEDQAKQADNIVKDFKDRGEQEKNDPNSGISQAYRKIMERFGVKVKGNPSAATIEKVAPWIAKAYEGEENRQARKEALGLALEQKKQGKEEKKQEKIDSFTKDFRKEMTTNFKTQYANFQNGQRAMTYIQDAVKNPSGFKDYGSLMSALKALQGDDSVVREAEMHMGTSVGSVIDKIGSSVKKAMSGQQLTTHQRQQMLDSVKVLADISRRQFQDVISPTVEQAKRMGIPLEELINTKQVYGSSPGEKKQPSDQKDPKIEAYAQQYGLDYAKAEQILRKRGYGQ